MLSDNYIFDALQAEREGEQFSIEFDAVWEAFGHSRKADALRYILKRSGLKKYDLQGFCQLALSYNQSSETNKIYLSCMSFKFALARANTKKGEEYLIHLLELEQRYLDSLERALNSEPNPEVTELKGRIAELEAKLGAVETEIAYPYKLEDLKKVSGIVNRSQLKSTVKQNFEQGADWIELDSVLLLTLDTFNILVLSLRSKRGTDITKLPSIIKIKTEQYFKFLNRPKRKNTCIAQREKELEDHGQLRVPGV